MAGNRSGGLKAAQKNLASDPDFYRKIGAKGGSATPPFKGFAGMPLEKHLKASAKGGRKSRKPRT